MVKKVDLNKIHEESLREFNKVQSVMRDIRMQCLQDRRFCSVPGAQWEGPLAVQFENKPKMEVNKIGLYVQRIESEYRSNRITVDFVSKEGVEYDSLADTCDGLYRADEQDSSAEEAYDNAFREGIAGGFGAWRLTTAYEDEEDEDDEKQRIRIEPIYDADSSVFFDLQAKRQDKADAKKCWVLSSMTYDSFRETWKDDPTTWPKLVHQYEFDWLTPDVVFVAEYFCVEMASEKVFFYKSLDGEEEKYREEELTDETIEHLEAIGSKKVREKTVKRRRVHKYIMSGNKILEDCGYIAGKHIPIIPFYAKRWFIDNVERCSGHVSLAKDAQRLANMQRSKLAEISAMSSVEKPILTAEQIAGHQAMWAEDNIKNYPYLLINSVAGPDGSLQLSPPVGYTKSPEIPPALAALLQMSEIDMKEVLGNQEQGEKIVANISGKAVEMVQNRLDTQTFLYISNFAKAIRRCGEVWLSMAKDVYVEPGRKMKSVGNQSQVSTVELMLPIINDEGDREYKNDLSEAEYDVSVEIGPSSVSKRASVVRSLTQMLAITQDPDAAKVIQAAALMNMEGEGLGDVREFFRKQLVTMGVIKPTEEEEQMLLQQEQQPDPNQIYLQAAAENEMAKAAKALADAEKARAEAELSKTKTVETLAMVSNEITQPRAEKEVAQQMPFVEQPPVKDPFQMEKERLQLEAIAIENAIKLKQLEQQSEQKNKEQENQESLIILSQALQSMQSAVQALEKNMVSIASAVNESGNTMSSLIELNKENLDKALKALARPKRVVREKGQIVKIEME